jgi:hypothetical protein
MGGDESPCVSDDMLEAEERMSGFPCPRREWPDGEGPYLFRLVQLGAYAERAHLFDASSGSGTAIRRPPTRSGC